MTTKQPTTLCYVTAFLDLGRHQWKQFGRSFEMYYKEFKPLITLFETHKEWNAQSNYASLIVFLDDQYTLDIPEDLPIQIIPINYDYMMSLPIWGNKIERERQIMASPSYQAVMANRIQYPEHHIPEYNMINHSKLDFIQQAMKISDAPYFAWIDFGYCKKPEWIPPHFVNVDRLPSNQITYQVLSPFTSMEHCSMYVLLFAPERIAGGFIFGTREVLNQYYVLYIDVLQDFQNRWMADDDQHVALRCCFNQSSLFHLPCFYEWNIALVVFSL